MKIHYFQHVPFEGPGSIETWAEKNGHALSATRFFLDENLPGLNDIDWLVVMGGPMNIYEEEEFPWLAREKQFIREAIQAGKVVIGICLGAQLIADVLGSRVTRNPEKEIGWFPIEMTPDARLLPLFNGIPSPMTVLHWHGDTFGLPYGAVRLAVSEGCENQAFLYNNRVLGLQFHIEFTDAALDAILKNCADELTPGKYIQTEKEIRSGASFLPPTHAVLNQLLDRLAAGTN